MTIVNNVPTVTYRGGGKTVAAARYNASDNTWSTLQGAAAPDTITEIFTAVSGNNLYIASIDKSGNLSVFKSAGATSALAKVGDSIPGVTAAKLICKGDELPHLLVVAGQKIYLYNVGETSVQRNTNFEAFDNNQKFREVEALYTNNGLIVVGVNTSYDAYYAYYGTDYKRKSGRDIIKYASSVSQVRLVANSSTLYMGYLSRDIEAYGPRIAKATINTSNVSWNMNASTAIREGVIAYHISLVMGKDGKTVYAAIDDNGRPDYSQVHVYRYDGSKWHLHGENELPYFGSVFYNVNGYYLRGWSPTVATDSEGKVYVSMLARENAAKTTHNNNGPLVMKYVADNWEIK